MFKTIINKLERYVIEYTIKHKKPEHAEMYDDEGHVYMHIDNIFHSQTRYAYDELGNQLYQIYASGDYKVYDYITSEYDGERCTKTHTVRFEVVGKTCVKVEDCYVTYKHDERGNILETIETNNTTQTIYRSVFTYDERNNTLTNKAIRTVGGKTEAIYSREYEYDANGNETLYNFYQKTCCGLIERSTVITKEYDEKNRIIYAHEAYKDYKKFYSRDGDVYYRYDDEHNAVIKFNNFGIWSYKNYEQTDILPNGYKVVRRWAIPLWTEKVRKFFKVD